MKGLYAIADVGVLARRGMGLRVFAEGLKAAGVGVVQLRDKDGSPEGVLAGARVLREVFAGTDSLLVMNDRVDLGLLAGFGGVHVGQGDLSVEDAKAVAGQSESQRAQRKDEEDTERKWVVGGSTHTEDEVRVADVGAADYVAVGPVFATGTKADASPVVGLEGVRRARALTGKPLVAIGGITLANARSVVDAGADMVAVITGLFVPGRTVESVAWEFGKICVEVEREKTQTRIF
ncbi:thiamine phosphate synthase [Granulicella tundricola]|uniref:Thiamine-phosphate synthase n=1 Tax=Granulicella tundricola (strain ATCC BAA-1859 / DSM 23138 / MP5ACTX9) TaxID=1198114 RepID=E8X037_GRATM|nr:thiamine phosphate synthase [Granulicella tundricola]ADW68933.1 thiamine monophosphate synthase [Granulicella tundricola MP5ACTX9]